MWNQDNGEIELKLGYVKNKWKAVRQKEQVT